MLVPACCGIFFFLGVILRERHPLDTFAVRMGSSLRPIVAPICVGVALAAAVMLVPGMAQYSAEWVPIALVGGWILDTVLQDLTWTEQEASPAHVIDLRRQRKSRGSKWDRVGPNLMFA